MRRKSLIILALVLAISVFATACASDSGEKTPEEPIVNGEDNSGDLQDNTEEDIEELKAEDITEDNWADSFMKNVPVLEGEVVSVDARDDSHVYVSFESVEYDEAVEYVEELKSAGFSYYTEEMVEEHIIKYNGTDTNNNIVKFHWAPNGRSGINLIRKDK